MDTGEANGLVHSFHRTLDWFLEVQSRRTDFDDKLKEKDHQLKAPLFQYRYLQGHMNEIKEQRHFIWEEKSRLPRLPFPFIKSDLWASGIDKSDGEPITMKFFIMAHRDVDGLFINGRWDNLSSGKWFIMRLVHPPEDPFPQVNFTLFDKSGAYSQLGDSKNDAMFTEVARVLYNAFFCFCFDYFTPHNHVVKVTPNKPHKSVEWKEAHSHYTLVHKSQSPIFQTAKPKIEGESHDIKRMAHSRRAHFKLLSHPRYKAKRGQRIFVRSAWIGPKEWKDKGSGQIYKIVEDSKQN